jgi:transcriptional regulator with XRE-family HTH domain
VNVPDLVKELRLDAGLSLRELAAASELAASTIHRTERGELNPTVDTLERIVSATGHRLRLDARPESAGSVLGLGMVLRRELSDQRDLSVVRRAAELASRFDAAPTVSKERMLLAEPPPVGVDEWDAFLGGFAEWLAVRSGMEAPAWTASPSRFLDRGWWVTPMMSMRAWEFAGTPVSLQRRGVFLHRESLINR